MSIDQLAIHDFVGHIVGEYQVEHVLHTEQTMVRYLARHLKRKDPVAITMYVFPETLSHQARHRFMTRFEAICSKLVTLHHSHLVPVYTYGEYQGAPYMVTGIGTGKSLAHVLKRQDPCTLRFTVQILKQIASGLEYAHQHGIIHGALKPESFLFSPSQTIQVAGCGLMQMVALQGIEMSAHPYAHLMTIAGTFLGTPESVAPECIQGHSADTRADVYGLGMVLFELLSGKPPFRGTDPFLTAMARPQLPIPSLHALRPDLPLKIDQVISSALAHNPAQRYQRVSDLVSAYSQVLIDQEEPTAPLRIINPSSDNTSSSTHQTEKGIPSTENWQVVSPKIIGHMPDLRISPALMLSPVQAPLESEMLAHKEDVSLFDVHLQGFDHLQYKVHTPVTYPQNQSEPPTAFPQPRQPVHKVDQSAEMANPLPTFSASASLQLEPPTAFPQPRQLVHEADRPEKMTDPLPAFPASTSLQSEPPIAFPQSRQLIHEVDQSVETADPLPAFPASASLQSENDKEASHTFLLRVVQPGLVGLMDGSVSTLAPIFATAFATHRPLTTFLVGMASATGAGISMAFAEALSDDGELTGRGNALLRGGITGLMTFLSGAGHTLPFLIPDIHLALILAYVVVAIELVGIAAIRHKFFHTSWWLSLIQVIGGGLLVFLAAMFFGNA
jgi:serine/threonine protein kinase